MSGLIAFILSNPAVLAIVGGVIAACVAFVKGRSSGIRKERAERALENQLARDIADEIENDIGAMPPDEARKELGKWSRD